MTTHKQIAVDQQTVTIRAPRELIERLEQLAGEGYRSLNQQIVMVMKEWLDSVEQEQGK